MDTNYTGVSSVEIYEKAYAYYTWSRAQNGRPPMVDKERYSEMVPLHEAKQIAAYYDQGVANGTIPVEQPQVVEADVTDKGNSDNGTNQGEGSGDPNGDRGPEQRGSGKRRKQSKR